VTIYLALFFIGVGFLVLTTLVDFGGDAGLEHGDVGGGGLDGDLPSPFSPRTIAGAATGFGAGGALALLNGAAGDGSLFFALLGGLVLGGTSYGFLVWLAKQQRSTHLVRGDLVGRPATVITAISGTGLGEIVVVVGGQTFTYLARSATGMELPRGSEVLIDGLAGEALLVSPVRSV
jgi:hypothetical protein